MSSYAMAQKGKLHSMLMVSRPELDWLETKFKLEMTLKPEIIL